jgi:hypothetical protein
MKKIVMLTAVLVLMSARADAGVAERAYGIASVLLYHRVCEPVSSKVKAAVKAELVRMRAYLLPAIEAAVPKLQLDVLSMGGDAGWCWKTKPIIERFGRSPQRDRRRLWREI